MVDLTLAGGSLRVPAALAHRSAASRWDTRTVPSPGRGPARRCSGSCRRTSAPATPAARRGQMTFRTGTTWCGPTPPSVPDRWRGRRTTSAAAWRDAGLTGVGPPGRRRRWTASGWWSPTCESRRRVHRELQLRGRRARRVALLDALPARHVALVGLSRAEPCRGGGGLRADGGRDRHRRRHRRSARDAATPTVAAEHACDLLLERFRPDARRPPQP